MQKRGLVSKYGNEITVGAFTLMLENPAYMGMNPSAK
jgi:hypothetical protein